MEKTEYIRCLKTMLSENPHEDNMIEAHEKTQRALIIIFSIGIISILTGEILRDVYDAFLPYVCGFIITFFGLNLLALIINFLKKHISQKHYVNDFADKHYGITPIEKICCFDGEFRILHEGINIFHGSPKPI